MADDLQVCVKTTLPIDRETEGRMVNYFWQLAGKQHLDMGATGTPNAYVFGSWLWKRLSYMNRYENDFSDRLYLPPQQGGALYAKSNKSLNFPKQFVKSYHAAATGDLETYGWFSVQPEGGEDENPALPLWERYLRERAKRKNLGMTLKNESARPMLIRGETICQVLKQRKLKVEPRSVKAVRDLREAGDVPLRDSMKRLVTELDEWVPDELEPETKLMLARDPKVWRMKDVTVELTKRSFKIEHVQRDETFAEIDFIHPGDFVFDVTRPSLDECVRVGSVVGRFFRLSVDDLFDRFNPQHVTAAGKAYKEQYGLATGNFGGKTAAETPKAKQGESPNAADGLTDTGALPMRLYFGGFFRYDWNNDGRREYVYVLMDWETKLPISYDPTSLVLESDTRIQPFKMLAISKKSFRAYGSGIYEEFEDLSESADQNYNRIFIEQQTSGKIIGFDPAGFEQTWAGQALQVRGNTLYKKRDGTKPLKEIVDVVQIPAETGELRENLNLDIQTMTARGGGVSPGEAEQAGLQGAQTATGLQILERQKSTLDGSIQDDINDGHADLVQEWAEVEADAYDAGFAKRLFAGKMVEVPNPAAAGMGPEIGNGMKEQWNVGPGIGEGQDLQDAGISGLSEPDESGTPIPGDQNQSRQDVGAPSPEMMGPLIPPTIQVPAAEVLAEWIQTVPRDELRSMIKLVLVKAKESEIASRADNRVKLVTQYSGLPYVMQLAVEQEFIELLTLNGSQDAEKTLKNIQKVTQQNEMAMQAQQQAAALQAQGAGSAPGGPPVPENADAQGPVTGRPEPEQPEEVI